MFRNVLTCIFYDSCEKIKKYCSTVFCSLKIFGFSLVSTIFTHRQINCKFTRATYVFHYMYFKCFIISTFSQIFSDFDYFLYWSRCFRQKNDSVEKLLNFVLKLKLRNLKILANWQILQYWNDHISKSSSKIIIVDLSKYIRISFSNVKSDLWFKPIFSEND